MPRLTDQQREKVIQILREHRYQCMFGDGMEDDYIMDGLTMVGLNQMTDEQLVEEYSYGIPEDDEFLVELQTELAVETLLKENPSVKTLTVKFDVSKLTQEAVEQLTQAVEVQGEEIVTYHCDEIDCDCTTEMFEAPVISTQVNEDVA